MVDGVWQDSEMDITIKLGVVVGSPIEDNSRVKGLLPFFHFWTGKWVDNTLSGSHVWVRQTGVVGEVATPKTEYRYHQY